MTKPRIRTHDEIMADLAAQLTGYAHKFDALLAKDRRTEHLESFGIRGRQVTVQSIEAGREFSRIARRRRAIAEGVVA